MSAYRCDRASKTWVCCCISKTVVGWERRMLEALTDREVLSAVETLRIAIHVCTTTLKSEQLLGF